MNDAAPKKKRLGLKIAGGVAALFVLVAIMAPSEEEAPAASPSSSSVVDADSKKADKKEPKTEVAAPVEKAEPSLTSGQENAIGSAESYLDFAAFSRSGLIEQLEFEDYSTADATFAVDSLNVNWKKQAVAQAENYLDLSHFSHGGMVDQLMFEGYSAEQAEYGATGAGL